MNMTSSVSAPKPRARKGARQMTYHVAMGMVGLVALLLVCKWTWRVGASWCRSRRRRRHASIAKPRVRKYTYAGARKMKPSSDEVGPCSEEDEGEEDDDDASVI